MHYACVARHTVLPYFNGLLTIVSSKLHCIPLDYIGLPYTTYSVRYIYILYNTVQGFCLPAYCVTLQRNAALTAVKTCKRLLCSNWRTPGRLERADGL